MTAFLSATVFWGQDGCPLTYCGEGKIMALEGDEFGKASSCPFLTSQYIGGGLWTGFLSVNPRGAAPVLLCLFALFLVLATA